MPDAACRRHDCCMSPHRRLATVIATATVAASGLGALAPAANASGHWWDNCTALHQRWTHGVGRMHAVDHTSGTPVTNFRHSNYWFGIAMSHNHGLDGDGDKIACEAH